MTELLQLLATKSALFPNYLIVLIVVFLILPTLAATLLRYALYRHLVSLEIKVRKLIIRKGAVREYGFIENIKQRFRESSLNLEHINTVALVDGFYSQEKFRFLGKSLRCESWEQFCRVLPNLLLTLGLLGTFFGITINLYNLSQTINQIDSSNVNRLVEELQQPLQGMGIAFSTSLIAIACSSLLTVVNLRKNTSLAKSRLINSLEDYLDNVYLPELPSHTRMDRAVNRMVEQQNQFLTKFHQNVTEAVESSLGHVAQQIADGNQEATSLAKQVYERFTETSGTLDRGATTFEYAVSSLEKQVQNITEVANQASQSFETLNRGSTIFKAASETIERSKFSDNLENVTANLADTQKAFSQSTSFLEEHIQQIVASNTKANNLAEQVYSQLQESSGGLSQSATTFQEASQTIEQSQFANHLSAAAVSLEKTHQQFANSTSVLQKSTLSIEEAIAVFQGSVQKIVHLSEQASSLNQHSVEIIALTKKRLVAEEGGSNKIKSELNLLVDALKNHEQKINSELQNLGAQLTKLISLEAENYDSNKEKLLTTD